ncbi:MAG: hypothetical protein NT151_07910 [Acidobacteria bacterium]|nr:hypothetical protein [Acidobacteriota bacterium]
MRRIGAFLTYGAVVLGLLGWANYTGWSLTSYDEVKNVPKSIRDNPGAYRTVYQRYYHK